MAMRLTTMILTLFKHLENNVDLICSFKSFSMSIQTCVQHLTNVILPEEKVSGALTCRDQTARPSYQETSPYEVWPSHRMLSTRRRQNLMMKHQ